MFGFPSKDSTNAVTILKNDHEKVKILFKEFEKTDDRKKKLRIAAAVIEELKVHATIEEEIFYPLVRSKIHDKALMDEADEEHHVAKVLIAELETMDGSESHYDGKFKVLAENVVHHIKEEENDMLPASEKTDIDMEKLGEKMLKRRDTLLTKGIPPVAEEKMVAASHGRGDSSAQNAKRTPKKKAKK